MVLRAVEKNSTEFKRDCNNQKVECLDVVIIGAGWAGLAAANTLQGGGVSNYTVLEARDYVGGRSVTTNELGEDIPIDLGSAWVQGTDENPVQALIDENRIPHSPTEKDKDDAWDCNGSLLDDSQWEKLLKRRSEFMTYMAQRQESDEEDTSLAMVLEDYATENSIGKDTFDYCGLRMILGAEICLDYGAPLSKASLYWWDSDEALKGGDSYMAVPCGGYSKVVDKFAERVLPNIQLQCKVTGIEYGGRAAKVCYSDMKNGEKQKVVLARHVLVTLPLGVLKAGVVNFSPPLPSRKRAAIRKLGNGLLNKCVLFWENMKDDEVFWPKDTEWITRMAPPGQQGKWTDYYNGYSMNGGKPVLIGFAGGDHAGEMEALSDADVTAQAVASLRAIFGKNVPEPTSSIVTRWGSDEYARGAYSFHQVGSELKNRKDLAKPVGSKLWFAGEATESRYPGTTHGAFFSGEKMARNILAKIEAKQPSENVVVVVKSRSTKTAVR